MVESPNEIHKLWLGQRYVHVTACFGFLKTLNYFTNIDNDLNWFDAVFHDKYIGSNA